MSQEHSNTQRASDEPRTQTVIVERDSGRSGSGGMMIGIFLIVALIVGGFFGMQYLQQGQVRTEAISEAAGSVGEAADKVGDAAQQAADKLDGG